MKNPHREIHRSTIKYRMYKTIDRLYEGLYGSFVGSIVFFGFGAMFFSTQTSGGRILGFIGFMLGSVMLAMHELMVHLANKTHLKNAWLKPKDRIIVAALTCLALILSGHNSILWQLVFCTAGLYGTWRLWHSKHWKSWYFYAARSYFREMKIYRHFPNNQVKRDARTAGFGFCQRGHSRSLP